MNYIQCRGYQVLPTSSYYPIHWNNWREYYTDNSTNIDKVTPTWLTKQVIGVHVWNKESSQQQIRKNSTQLYVQFAKKYCPVTFSHAPDIFQIYNFFYYSVTDYSITYFGTFVDTLYNFCMITDHILIMITLVLRFSLVLDIFFITTSSST